MIGTMAAIGPCAGCVSCEANVSRLRAPRTVCATISHTHATAAPDQRTTGTTPGRPSAAVSALQTAASPAMPKPIANVFNGILGSACFRFGRAIMTHRGPGGP